MKFDPTLTWYHGSPYELILIRTGSTITQKRGLAEAFSHKPPLVCVEDDGRIKHNGTLPGYLYRIKGGVNPEDVYPHPNTSMPPGDEWLTSREFELELLGPVEIKPEEQFSDAELAALLELLNRRD